MIVSAKISKIDKIIEKIIIKYMKNNKNIHISNRETYKNSKHYCKIHEKKYTNFHTTTQETYTFSKIL